MGTDRSVETKETAVGESRGLMISRSSLHSHWNKMDPSNASLVKFNLLFNIQKILLYNPGLPNHFPGPIFFSSEELDVPTKNLHR